MVSSKNKSNLKINPQPFKSSYLAIPPSPCSPRTPLLLSSNTYRHRSHALPTPDTAILPHSPMQWLWQCHQCRRTYSLGVTRRCLEDGHHFCAGSTTVKTWRKSTRPGRVKRHRACASEFDYQGWKAWGGWRRSGRRDSIYEELDASPTSPSLSSSTSSSFSSDEEYQYVGSGNRGFGREKKDSPVEKPTKDCWNTCDYPSECRWGKRFGVHTPITSEFPALEVVNPTPAPPPPPPPPPPAPSANSTREGILKPENCKEVKRDKKTEKTDFWAALVASATRRKSVAPSSPLASVAEEPEEDAAAATETAVDRDGDVCMATIDPALLVPQATPRELAATSPAPLVSFKDMMRRRNSKRAMKASKPVGVKERKTTEAMLGVSRPETMTLTEFDFGLEEAMDPLDEFAPLERVKSRDSGYQSNLDMW